MNTIATARKRTRTLASGKRLDSRLACAHLLCDPGAPYFPRRCVAGA